MSRIYEGLISRLYERNTRNKLMVFFFPIPIIAGFLFLKLRWNNVYQSIVQEDSYVETMQFFAYSIASILAFYSGRNFFNKNYLLNFCILFFLAFLLMFVSLEEISWGQRIFGTNTPTWFQQHNVQNEISLHNLKPAQDVLHQFYVLTGFLCAFGWILAKYVSNIKRLRVDVRIAILLFCPRWYMMLFFMPTIIIYSYFLLNPNLGNFVIWSDQEPAELLLALGFLLFVISIMMRQKFISGNENK